MELMMQSEGSSYEGPREVEAGRGLARLGGQRVVLLDPSALWRLRGELIGALGREAARSALTQSGFAHGWKTADAVEAEPPRGERSEAMDSALRALAQQGLFTFEKTGKGPPSRVGVVLRGSFEAEEHARQGVRAQDPVCWMLCGIISGYLSRAEGEPIFVLEDRCLGRGDEACHVVARTRAGWGEDRARELAFFDVDQGSGLAASALADVTSAGDGSREGGPEGRTASSPFAGIDDPLAVVAESSAMTSVLDLTRRVALSEATVIISGESGVGKERIARLLHDWSPRARGPFVAVNCGAMTDTLLDSELFGHARGAFTGALRDHQGLFDAASGGTLLLDEVGDVSPSMQVKLLRALQEREIRRVGESSGHSIDVRILGATNRDLAAAVASGAFRSDLYYRLKVVELHIPPLRARRDDIMSLARTLLATAARRMNRKIEGFSPSAAARLLAYRWPGNVRELENIMERAVALAMGDRIEVGDLPDEVRHAVDGEPDPSPQDVRPLKAIEKEYILASLESNGGNQTHTAQQLEIGSATLYRKLKSYGVLSGQRSSATDQTRSHR